MSQELKLMAVAEHASQLLRQYEWKEGEGIFETLLRHYPNDGMVCFKRAQAYEAVGAPEIALADYRQAVSLFPMREWKNLAQEGVARCKTDLQLKRLPREVRSTWPTTTSSRSSRSTGRPSVSTPFAPC